MRPRRYGRGCEWWCSTRINIQAEYAHDGACMLKSKGGEADELLTDYKLKVVKLAMKNGNRNDGREYTVNEKLVYD